MTNRVPLGAALALLIAALRPTPAPAQDPTRALCTPANTVAMSVRTARFIDRDLDGALDRWVTQGDFNYTAGTVFDPVDETPPEGPKVWIFFESERLADSATQVFVDSTTADRDGHHFSVAVSGSSLRVWKYSYRPAPDERIGFFRGRFRNLPASSEPSNKIRFQLLGLGESFLAFTPPAGFFKITQTLLVDNRPDSAIFCATASACCRAQGPDLRIKCRSNLAQCP